MFGIARMPGAGAGQDLSQSPQPVQIEALTDGLPPTSDSAPATVHWSTHLRHGSPRWARHDSGSTLAVPPTASGICR